MSSSLVLELQQEAMNPQVKVSDLLRKALVVATKLNLEELRVWIEHELRGYGNESVPSYRHIQGEVKVINPYHGLQPMIFEDPEEARILSERNIAQKISELESLVQNGGLLQIPFPDAEVARLADTTMGMPPTLIIGASRIVGILDAVRNAILEWSLKLEKDNILGQGMTFSREEKAQADSATYNIQNFTGVIGTVNTNAFQIGNYNSIHSELKRLGIPQPDRAQLENIMDRVGESEGPEKAGLVKQGLEWVLQHGSQLGAMAEMLRNWFQSQVGG